MSEWNKQIANALMGYAEDDHSPRNTLMSLGEPAYDPRVLPGYQPTEHDLDKLKKDAIEPSNVDLMAALGLGGWAATGPSVLYNLPSMRALGMLGKETVKKGVPASMIGAYLAQPHWDANERQANIEGRGTAYPAETNWYPWGLKPNVGAGYISPEASDWIYRNQGLLFHGALGGLPNHIFNAGYLLTGRNTKEFADSRRTKLPPPGHFNYDDPWGER